MRESIGFMSIAVFGIILFSVILFIGAHDDNIKARNTVDELSCYWVKDIIIDIQQDLIFKDARYYYAIEKWNSDECKEERESMN